MSQSLFLFLVVSVSIMLLHPGRFASNTTNDIFNIEIVLQNKKLNITNKCQFDIHRISNHKHNYQILTLSEEMLASRLRISPGGEWRPDCGPVLNHVNLLIPFRDRWDHLEIFVWIMHPYLQVNSFKIFLLKVGINRI